MELSPPPLYPQKVYFVWRVLFSLQMIAWSSSVSQGCCSVYSFNPPLSVCQAGSGTLPKPSSPNSEL